MPREPRQEKSSNRKYVLPDFIHKAIDALKPPESLTVSEWAEKYRILDSKSSAMPGPWKNRITPYLVDIMDEFNNPYSEEIIFVKPTQVGGTEVLLNVLGYMVHQDPYPAMVVYPTDRSGEENSDLRIKPMLLRSPVLRSKFRPLNSTKVDLDCGDDMNITIAGANSPSGLASKPIGKLFLDEVDKYPSSTKKEADPIKLARERTKTFAQKKIFTTSTPTIKQGHIWRAKESADVVKKYYVPCPHCGKMIEFLFKQITWPQEDKMSISERSEYANYVCQECGCIITDSHKPQMLIAGKWKPVEGNPDKARIVCYWINTLYSPFVRWHQIAKEFLLSKESPETLQNFVNSWLAEPWEDVVHKTDTEMVLEKRSKIPEFVVPEWARLLTCGADVQRDKIYYTIRAWGAYITSQTIHYGEVPTLNDLEEICNVEYKKESGESMLVNLAAIDSGDQTDDVYDFCFDNQDWAVPVKGASNPMVSRFKISTINKTDSKAFGTRLVTVDGNAYKDTIAARMHKPMGTGCWMVHADTEKGYAEQVTAEQKVNEKRAGKIHSVWRPKMSHADNHYLDCEVYAFCAADLLHVRQLHLEAKEEEAQPEEPRQDNNQWLKTEGWING